MRRKFWLKAIALGLLAVVIVLVGGTVYLSRMQTTLWEYSINNVLEVTTQGGKSFETYVDQGFSVLEGRGAHFSQCSSADADTIGDQLDLYENGDPAFSVLDLTNGVIYYNSRERRSMTAAQVKRYLDMPEKGVFDAFISEYTGLRVTGYYERFTFKDGAQGMVRKCVPISEVSDRFTLSFYDGSGFSYIVNADGEIMLRSVNANGNRTYNNVFDVVALDDNTKEDVAAFRTAMSGRRRGVMRLNFGGEEHIFAFVPLNGTDGWYLVSIIPNQVIMERADQMIMASQLMIAVMAVALLIFGGFLLILLRHRKQVQAKEAEVRYREQLFNLLVENTDDVFLMVNGARTEAEYISPNVERVLGISREAVEEDVSCLKDVMLGIEHEEDLDRGKVEIPMGSSISFTGKYVHTSTQETRWFVETVYHTMIENMERYIVVLADRTEERKKEAALNDALRIATVANDSKSTFLANMSHDIRTPMNAIVGLSTLLQRDAENPEKVREHTEKITASSQHLLGLINDVLDMSKIESGKTTLNIAEFNLAALIQGLDTIVRPQTKAKGQSFDIQVHDVVNEELIGDQLRINQVMINILSNAVKYTGEGGHITLTVRQLGEVAQDIVRIRFVVADDGIGMSEDYQKVIFQPFTREIRTTVNRIQGTGLGMAITKNLVDLMGGNISVESKLGEGSTFTIDFDFRVRPQEDDVNFWKDHNISSVLVVDDEEDICAEVLSAMAGTGVSMQFALDGATAVQMTQRANQAGRDFDLILLDWKMPGMDGLETARLIRATVSTHIPIMILSAYDWEDIRDEGIAAGVDGFMTKPFFLSSFKEVVRSIQAPGKPTSSVMEKNPLAGCRFLCAEDNELNAEILLELLDMVGAEAEVAVNGQEAVEMFAAAPEGKYAAVLMDVQMPVMNGYEATRAIRALDHPQAATIPIVAMTANAFADDIRDALESGMNAHVAKPVDMDKLVETLVRLWEK